MTPPSTAILGVPVSIVDLDSAVATILDWVAQGIAQYVCVRDVHGVMLAQDDPEYRDIHAYAGMVTPDGMPLVWIARARGHRIARVCGADLTEALCAASILATRYLPRHSQISRLTIRLTRIEVVSGK